MISSLIHTMNYIDKRFLTNVWNLGVNDKVFSFHGLNLYHDADNSTFHLVFCKMQETGVF